MSDAQLTKLRRQHIGFVFQFFNLLPMLTAEENAALGLPMGVLLAALTTRALGSLGIGFHLPVQQLGAFVLLAAIAGSQPLSSRPAERHDSTCCTHSSTSNRRPHLPGRRPPRRPGSAAQLPARGSLQPIRGVQFAGVFARGNPNGDS
jgi:hypothetical protein